MDEGENELAAPQRDLAEETGSGGGRWRRLRRLYPSPGGPARAGHALPGGGARRGERDLDEGDELELVRLTPEELEATLPELEDSKTLAGILLVFRD